MSKILFSITTWNQSEYTKICLDSLKNINEDCDILVIDDASTDNTIDLCKEYGVKYIDKKVGLGLTDSWNQAYKHFVESGYDYLIIANNANYAKMKQKMDVTAIDDQRNLDSEMQLSDAQESIKDFTNLWVEYYDTNLNRIFTNRKDIIVADTILELFRMRDNIENFNKKALYILIRERTGLKTQNITKVINVMKRDYSKMFMVYKQNGLIASTNR